MDTCEDQAIGKIALPITTPVMKGTSGENIEGGLIINYVLLVSSYKESLFIMDAQLIIQYLIYIPSLFLYEEPI